MSNFINRTNELATLTKEYNRSEASFVVIYGRRRVGKTTLINHFCKDKKAIYFLATEESETENRNAFKKLIGEQLHFDLLLHASVDKWEPVFDVVTNAASNSDKRIVLVLDEFQYLGKANPAFPSILMNIWDTKLKDKNIMLILCGSLINMMTSQVLSYDSPLSGRRTAQIKLGQVAFEHYHEFNETLSVDEQIQHYAVTGGVPKYIELFEHKETIFDAIQNNILSRNAFLYAEPEFLLQKEVSEIGSYFSILKTIANGNHKLGKIAAAMEVSQSKLTNYLKILIDLDLIERQVPITEEHPEKSKKGLYFIKDNFIDFWFKFVYPYRGILEANQDTFVLDKIKKNFIDNHVSYVYEEICRQKVWSLLDQGLLFNRVGRWWGNGDVEIDLVAYDSQGTDILFGECKYSKNPKGKDVLDALIGKAVHVNWKKKERNERFVIYSKSGFTKELKEFAKKREGILLLEMG